MRSRSSRRNEIGERIGSELRALYDEVLREPVPDRFCELLRRLEEETTAAAGRSQYAREGAASPSTAHADQKALGLPSRQRRAKPHCLEPAE
jgi:anti-sigma factor NepR-like protein